MEWVAISFCNAEERVSILSACLTPTLSPTHTGSNLEAQSGCQSALSPSRARVETGFLVSGARKIWARILAPETTGCGTLTLSILLRNREIKKKRPRQPGALLENTCEGSATLFHKQRTFYGFFPTPTSIFTRSRLPFVTSRIETHLICVRKMFTGLCPRRGNRIRDGEVNESPGQIPVQTHYLKRPHITLGLKKGADL